MVTAKFETGRKALSFIGEKVIRGWESGIEKELTLFGEEIE
jgi:hypothetical protein